MLMVLHGHLGACCTLEFARVLKHWRPWDEDASSFPGHLVELAYILCSWAAFHAPADHHLWPGHTERHNNCLRLTIPVTFRPAFGPSPPGPSVPAAFHSLPAPHTATRLPSDRHIEPTRAPMATAITWNVGPTHLTYEKIDEMWANSLSRLPRRSYS